MPDFIELAVEEIVEEEIYRLSYFRSPEKLKISISHIGQTQPLFCREEKGKAELFSGFLRKRALDELGFKSANVILWKENEISALKAFKMAFFENALSRGLNVIEQAKAVLSFKELKASEEEIKEHFKKAHLGLKISLIQKLPQIFELNDVWKKYLVEKNFKAKDAELILRFEKDELDQLEVFIQLGASYSQFRQLVEMIDEIKRRDSCSAGDILERVNLKKIISQKNFSSAEKLAMIIDEIKKIRYPELSRLISRHQKICEELNLPEGAKLKPVDWFEKPEYELELKISPQTPASEQFKKLLEISQSPVWKKLFEFNED